MVQVAGCVSFRAFELLWAWVFRFQSLEPTLRKEKEGGRERETSLPSSWVCVFCLWSPFWLCASSLPGSWLVGLDDGSVCRLGAVLRCSILGRAGSPEKKKKRERETEREIFWVAVKELKLSYYIGETPLSNIYIYTHYGNLI